MKINQNTRRLIRRYYFSNKSALLLPLFFSTVSLLIFIQQFSFFSLESLITEKNYLNAIQIYILLFGMIAGLYFVLRKLFFKLSEPAAFEVKPFINTDNIRRDEQQAKLKEFLDAAFEKKHYAFIVGKSGSGKSTLVRNYTETVKDSILFNGDDYKSKHEFEPKLDRIINDYGKAGDIRPAVIIFDQFERAIEEKIVFDYIIDFLKNPKENISIAFVCMPEDYARVIESLQSGLLEEEEGQKSYDVFISFKNSDSRGQKTKDGVIADKLYSYLKDKGINVFFSNRELEITGSSEFRKAIDEALKSAKILIAVGCSEENLSSEWVYYEWDGFQRAIMAKRKKDASIFVLYEDMNPNDLPWGLSGYQAINASGDNAYEVLYNFIVNSDAYKQQDVNSTDTEDKKERAFETKTYFLKALLKENRDILAHIVDILKLPKGGAHIKFFDGLLNTSDSISMIEINMARKYVETVGLSDSAKLFTEKDSMELIKEEYFEKLLANTECPVQAMVILYALSNCGYSEGLTISDFKNISFAPVDTIKQILKIFEEQKIIKRIYDELPEETPYAIVHDYLIRYLESYCRRKLSEQVSTNIRDYCEMNNQYKINMKSRTQAERKVQAENLPLSYYYENSVQKKQTSNFIVFCMILLGTAITTVSLWNEIKGYGLSLFYNIEFEWNHLTHAIIILAVGCAIFYVYHYLQYFAKIFFSKKFRLEWWICGFLIAGGMTVITLSLIFNAMWAAWIATGWSIIGILHMFLSTKDFPNENSSNRLRSEGWLYLVVAIVIIILNLSVILLEGNMYPYYAIFIVFLLLTIRQHINTDYMLAKTGVFVNYSIMTWLEEND